MMDDGGDVSPTPLDLRADGQRQLPGATDKTMHQLAALEKTPRRGVAWRRMIHGLSPGHGVKGFGNSILDSSSSSSSSQALISNSHSSTICDGTVCALKVEVEVLKGDICPRQQTSCSVLSRGGQVSEAIPTLHRPHPHQRAPASHEWARDPTTGVVSYSLSHSYSLVDPRRLVARDGKAFPWAPARARTCRIAGSDIAFQLFRPANLQLMENRLTDFLEVPVPTLGRRFPGGSGGGDVGGALVGQPATAWKKRCGNLHVLWYLGWHIAQCALLIVDR
ncbi:hypothetical protein G7046_g681 [Stylonectria norvegica]|nr:hypothetical protein G7046_g681 [Stylonectria norvegica]